jgi:hypothetical protein
VSWSDRELDSGANIAAFPILPFHVEHIVASVHHSDNRLTNLAWACPRCNLRKGPNLTTIDPETGFQVDLFNPRTMTWAEHFVIRDAYIAGISSNGRGTVRLLDMNKETRLTHRQKLIEQGEFSLD